MSWRRRQRRRRSHIVIVAALCATAALLGGEAIAGGTREPAQHAVAAAVRADSQTRGLPRRRACQHLPPAQRVVTERIARVHVHPLAHRGHEPHANLRVTVPARVVVLTFDDGPSPVYTPAIVQILSRARARATFFVIGALALGHPAILRQESSAADEIANHTFDHEELADADGSLRLPKPKLQAEIERAQQAICQAGVPAPALFRPPYGRGLFNPQIARVARAHGEEVVGWDLALDRFLSRGHGIAGAVSALLARLRPGSIILLHDGIANRQATVRALPMLLAGLADRGYGTTTVSALLHS